MTEREALATLREMRAESGRHSAHEVAALDLAIDALARKHPEPEITEARIDAAERILAGCMLTFATSYRDAARMALEAALSVPVREGEHGCPFCEEVRRMDATYGSQIVVCIKHRTQPVPPAAPDWMPRIGGDTA